VPAKSDKSDSIVAPATAPGTAALAIVRVSGPHCLNIIQKFLLAGSSPDGNPDTTAKDPSAERSPLIPRRMNYGAFRSGEEVVDSLTWVYFAAPHSYTGEDVLELFCHGNPLIVQKITRLIATEPGLRLAEPGEFTCRAFESGKMDLVQAEAVGDLIHAHTRADLANAQRLLEGSLSESLSEIQKKIKTISAHLELEVDFAEEEADADQENWLKDLQDIQHLLQEMLRVYQDRSRQKQMPKVAVCGTPNAGKSSLLNALLQEDRLLVSSEAGTTRDYVEIPVLLEQGEILLVDTAGLSEQPVSELDRLSMEKTVQAVQKSDAILVLLDGLQTDGLNSLEILEKRGVWGGELPAIVVSTKSDAPGFAGISQAEAAVSAVDGTGLDFLRDRLNSLFFNQSGPIEDLWLGNERQAERVEHALRALERGIELLQGGASSPELLAFEMQIVRDSMAEILGEITTDDILHHIFHGFCIGK